MKKYICLIFTMMFGCVSIPEDVQPINNFNLQKYLGTWYEIARFDHSFERGLSKVTANYSLRDDGGVKVLNKGFLSKDNKWKEATGKAFFVDDTTKGFLKVSFFGPFYGSYIIIDLDTVNYQYSMVCGPDKDYLWILSRTNNLDDEIKERLINKAKLLKFDTNKLIMIEH